MKLAHEVDIERRPDVVFSWLADPVRAAAWMSSVAKTEILHRTPDLVGTRFRETVADAGGSTELQGVVTACRPNREIAFHLDGRFNEVDVGYRLEEGRERTRLTMRAEIRFKGGLRWLSLLAWPLFKRKAMGQFRRECAELKRLCESQASLDRSPGAGPLGQEGKTAPP